MVAENNQSTQPDSNAKRIRVAINGEKRIYLFVPQLDITTHELAEAMTMLQVAPMVAMRMIPPKAIDAIFNQFSEEVQRHFTIQPISSILVPQGVNGRKMSRISE